MPVFATFATRLWLAVLLLSTMAGSSVDAGPLAPSDGRLVRHRSAASVPETGSIYVVLKLGKRRVYVMEADDDRETQRLVESFPVAVGRREYETPTGRFEITEKIADPDWLQFDWDDPSRVIRRIGPGPDNPLGLRWIGFTAAYGWGIGFHGTPQPELIGQAVSHGCVRMRNSDVVKLYGRVTVGTPVIVEP